MADPIEIPSTSLAAVQANSLSAVKLQVANLNNNLIAIFTAAFNGWSVSVMAGRVPNTDPPKPPMAFVVGYVNDPTSGPGTLSPYGDVIIQWPQPAVGTQPVCPMPHIPEVPVHAEGTWKIGIAIPGGNGIWFQALEGDKTPDGATGPGTSQDGVTGLFQKVGFPMGTGWFKKIG